MILYGFNPHQMIPTAQALRQKGKAARAVVSFADQSTFIPVDRDVNAMIEEQNHTRLPELLALRRERMSVSPFTFYRGTAQIMAHDLAHQAITGTPLIICGDAHINNFGLYASPERRLVFDLNDFDEAAPGPWEMNELTSQGFLDYVEGCGLLLARAHAQSPNANFVAGYMGKSDTFEKAIVKWRYDYSRQVYQDYEKFIR